MFIINDLEKILKKVIEVYKCTYEGGICAIYLYGSYARGTYTDTSDVDIVAVVKGERKELQNKLKQVWDEVSDISLEYDIVISPTVIPYDEFENYKEILPYYKNILNEGVKISAWLQERIDRISVKCCKRES